MSLENLTKIDPYKITQEQCPIFVQSADIKSFFGWGIRKRTKSNWNHSMLCRKPGYVVTQGNTYHEVDIGEYMKPGQMMKFWICDHITSKERNAIIVKINAELIKPWWKRMYDWPGVLGQLFGLRWFNMPGLNYCSERVSAKIEVILPEVTKHPTPEDIDTLFKNSDRMRVLGYYWGDT